MAKEKDTIFFEEEEIVNTEVKDEEIDLDSVTEVSESELNEDIKECDCFSVDAVKHYLREISKKPLLSKEEVNDLIRKGDDASKKKVAEHNLRLAYCVAKRYYNQSRSIQLLDLIQEANLGLIKAIDRFDPDKGYTFSTYATWWCTAAVRRCLQENSSAMRLPVYVVEMISKIKNAQQKFESANIEYTEEDLAKATGLKVSDIRKALAAQKSSEVLSLDYESDDKDNIGKTIVDENENVESNYLKDERTRTIANIISDICTERETDILMRHFGFMGEKETFDELAAEYGVSKQRIGQLYKKALEKLSTPLAKSKLKGILF